MVSIQDLMEEVGRRDGVEAAIVLGSDGLAIHAHRGNGLNTDDVAALVPPVIAQCRELGEVSGQGNFSTAMLEYGTGLALVTVVSDQAYLVILLAPDTNAGPLLFDMRRYRSAIADLF